MLRFRWITFDRFKVVNLSRFYRVNFIRPYWVNFTVFSNKTDIQDNTRIKHRCTLFVDKILYRRMHEDKMRGGLPALIRPRIV